MVSATKCHIQVPKGSTELLSETKPDKDALQNHTVTENLISSVLASQNLLWCVTKLRNQCLLQFSEAKWIGFFEMPELTI